MTTKRMSFQLQQQASHHHHQQHQQHHHAQRRPPDVEEALSSMLWTPYERASTTDTSSDDEDEHLQRQLKKSKSQYDYTSVPTTIPPLTPPPLPAPATLPMPLPTPTALALPTSQFPLPPTHLTPTNIVAYITTATPLRAAAQAAVAATSLLTCTPVRTASAATATSSYYTAEDLCDPSVVTPLVPFSNFMLNAHTMTKTTSNNAANNDIDANQGDNDDDDDDDVDDDVDGNVDTIVHDINVDDTFNDVVYRNENRLAATSSSLAMMSSSYQQKNRYSSSSSSSFSTFGRIPSLTKWWSTSSNTQSNTVSIAAQYDNSNATAQLPPASASTLTDEANKQPPSYESLYNKKQHPLRPQRPQRHSHSHSHNRLNKHLNLFKPVLETLKANVTTITQGRFTSLARPDNNCRVADTNNTTTTNALNQSTATLTPILTTATTTATTTTTAMTIATEEMGENSSNSMESTSNNLVHSFTDNFLHEHCRATQHVAATNVANNEHIINNNNNNNDTLTTDNNMNGETPNQSHEILIHQQQQQQQQQQHTHLEESTNTKSKQNQEHENKQNNNFIISQQQQQQQQKQEQLLLTITTNENNENQSGDEQTKMNTKTKTVNEQQQQLTTDHREPTMDVFNTTTTTTSTATTTNSMIEESSLLYDSSSAISLTRSFEANTSYTFDCTPNNANSFNKFSYETRKTNDTTTTTTTISNTYNLTPNKCLAELERLYAEFRASESIREQKLREHQNLRQQNAPRRRNLKDIATETENMRLNVPASNSANAEFNSRNGVGVVKAVSETKLNPSTSSVFLTTTNSLTTITNPCQRTPSLTIQVNQNHHKNSNSNNISTNTNTNTNTCNNNNNHNNNNNNNNNINNNNNNDANDVASATNTGQHDNDLQQQVFLNQAIVNTTTNGVSVINCNYVNNNNYSNSNNSNNNNNNKSITNLQDSVTNSKSITNPTSTSSSSSTNNLNNNHDPTDHIKSNNKNITGGVSDNIPNSSVPQVLNASDENLPTTNSSPLKQVNVIKVNERVEKPTNSNASTPAQSPRRRTFTSTECQTDDIASVQLRSPSAGRPPLTSTSSANSIGFPHSTTNNREQRRRERRERRHLQHTASLMVAPTHHSHPHPPHPLRHASLMDRHSMPTPPLPPILHPPHLHLQQTGHHNVAMLRPMLPDILHNHFPPPYSALPPPPPPPTVGSGSVPHHHNGSPLTFSHAPPTQSATATILGPPPPPPPAGTTLLTSVISTVPIPGATPMVSDGRFTLPLPIMRRSPSERSGKGCCGQWFAGPPLRALIAVVALGGVACALGGAALGATGLAGPPSSHFTAALLMIGVGVVLVTVSGAAWRMTAPGGPPCLGLGSSVDLGRCGRRPCSRGGGAPQGLLYPEFQHRPPPPSYQASMQEYRLRLLLLDRDRQNGVVRGSSPPPTYRSHAGSLLRAPLTSTIRGTQGLSGGRCESSNGGSEYSFPPSYRSRHTTPGTISSERSIETEPSGRLLANEDIPEPLSVDQLSEYNSLQQRTLNTSNVNSQKSEQKRNSIQLDSPDLVTKSEVNLNHLNSDKKNDLVTIVTITPNSNDIMEVHENRNNISNGGEGNGNEDLGRNSESREQIEILAHL